MKKQLLFALICIPFFTIAQTITVPNGDFETPANPTGTNVQNWAGDWFESNADMQPELLNQINGTYSVRFTGAGASNTRTLTTANAKSFAVELGKTYRVTFNCRIQTAAGASGGVNTDNNTFTGRAIETIADGSTIGATIASVSTTSPTNTQLSFNFTITNPTPKIKLQFTKDGGIAYLDDVTLEDLGVLPITLTSFVGQASNYGIKLNWTTASETNNQYFEILKAGENKNFVSIGRVDGSGNSTTTKSYSFDDFNPVTGNNYYQLRQIDFDGKTESFTPIAVSFGLTSNKISLLSSSDMAVTVSISSATDKAAVITYLSLDGRIVFQQKTYLTAGLNSVTLPVNKSTGNIGIISVSAHKEQQSIKVSR